jgi:hypothetical protein
VLAGIIGYTVRSYKCIEIDLETCAGLRDLCAILNADMRLHDNYIKTFPRINSFNLSLRASHAQTTFSFQRLQRLLMTHFKHRQALHHQPQYVRFGTEVKWSITLHIHLDTPTLSTLLEDICINVMPLLVVTFTAGNMLVVKIVLHTGAGRVEEHVTTLRTLRLAVLETLECYAKMVHYHNPRIRYPEVWMNGSAVIVDVVSTEFVDGMREHIADPARTNPTFWNASKTDSIGIRVSPITETDGLARSMYLYLKWITRNTNRERRHDTWWMNGTICSA